MVTHYPYTNTKPTWANTYLWPPLRDVVTKLSFPGARRAFDLGCGNGATSGFLSELGFDVTGIDPSESGIGLAKATHPQCRFEIASTDQQLAARFGQFPLVVSLEVVEHVYDPKRFAQVLYDLTAPNGTAIISTPYHGYFKNLALAVSGKMDSHFTALWDCGHIKFFSIKTLYKLLEEAGFSDIRFLRIGRIPPLAKSMMAVAVRPGV